MSGSEAINELEKARELSPTLNGIDSDIARVQILRQQFNEALTAIGRVPAGPVRDNCVALTYRAPGQRAAADAALARLEARADVPVPDAELAIAIAEVYAYRGDNAAALKWADRALLPTDPKDARLWTREEMVAVALPQGAACRRALEHADRHGRRALMSFRRLRVDEE